jgi:hypothetical protein
MTYTIPPVNNTQAQGAIYDTKQDIGYATLAVQAYINLVSCVLAHTFEFQVWRSPTIYSLMDTPYGGCRI